MNRHPPDARSTALDQSVQISVYVSFWEENGLDARLVFGTRPSPLTERTREGADRQVRILGWSAE